MRDANNENVSASVPRGLRVLVLSPWGASGGYSGPLTFLSRLFQAVGDAEPDLKCTLLYRDRGSELIPRWVHASRRVVRSRGFGRLDQLRWMVAASWAVFRMRSSVDFVHLHGAYMTNLIPALFAQRGQVLLVPVLEDGDLGAKPSALKTRLLSWVAQRTRVGFALSEGIVEELQSAGIDGARIVRIGNPVDVRMLRMPRETWSDAVSRHIGFVGKIGPLKNPHLIIEAVSELRARGFDYTAHYFGPFASDDVKGDLLFLAARLSVTERVHFHGYVTDVSSALEKIGLFVLPSSKEGLPGSLLEAMARGVPAIVSPAGSMGEVISASGGGAVVTPDAGEIADAALTLSEPSEWERSSKSARSFAEAHFAPSAVAASYISALRSST